MAKPIEVGVAVVAALGMGGTFFAGYLLGRGTAPPPPAPPPAHTARVDAEADADADDADEPDEAAPIASVRPPRAHTKEPSSPDPREPSARRLPPISSYLVVTTHPYPESPVIAVVSPSDAITYREEVAGWRRIEWSRGSELVTGWVAWGPDRAASNGGLRTGKDRGEIRGIVRFSGKPPEMKVPKKRQFAVVCQDHPLVHDAVIVHDGRLQDVVVGIERGGAPGKFKPPSTPVRLSQIACVYAPRIQGAGIGQRITITNDDATLHNVHVYKDGESLWNLPQPKGAAAITKDLPEGNLLVFKSDVHPWMRSFMVLFDHPFFAVSGDDGAFTIRGVPKGRYVLRAWHSHYGLKTREVVIEEGKPLDVEFAYREGDPEPAENKDELKDLW